MIFQPYAGASAITLYDSSGTNLGQVENLTLFDVVIPEILVSSSRKFKGIDSTEILKAIAKIDTAVGRLIQATVPFEAHTTVGTVIPPGTPVYLNAKEMTEKGRLRPSGTFGGDLKNAERFNRKLQDKGIVGVSDKPLPHNESTHPRVQLTEQNQPQPAIGDQFLSSPTCSCANGSCQMTSYFGRRASGRTTNGRQMSTNHQGLDIGGGAGTPIIAAADGCVSRKLTYRNGGYGLSLFIDHGQGFTTQYSHMRGFARNARVGQCFRRGDKIGYMGQTGNCTGPHLHFGVWHEGKAVDPRKHMVATTNSDLSLSCSNQPTINIVTPETQGVLTSAPRRSSSTSTSAAVTQSTD